MKKYDRIKYNKIKIEPPRRGVMREAALSECGHVRACCLFRRSFQGISFFDVIVQARRADGRAEL